MWIVEALTWCVLLNGWLKGKTVNLTGGGLLKSMSVDGGYGDGGCGERARIANLQMNAKV
jgi:hypothetical protein